MLAYRNPDRKKSKALYHRTIRCTIESYGDTVQIQVLYLGDRYSAVAGCGVHVPRLASPRSTAVVTDSLAVHSAGARAHAAQPARRLCVVALPVTVHESDLTFLPRAGSFCHPLPLHVRVPLSASDGSRHPNDGGACASQGLLHTAFASRAREKYRTH